MRAQFSQMMGFVIIAIVVILVLVFMKFSALPSLTVTLGAASEHHEMETLRAGANTLFYTTEAKTGKPIIEVAGIAAYAGTDIVNFGPGAGKVNVTEEIIWRMDAMFGEGKWYVRIPVPTRLADIEMVIVSDVSASMCDDIKNLKKLPEILETLKLEGRKASATLYFLPGAAPCIVDGKKMIPECGIFTETENFKCRAITELECENNINGEEDWGNGLACAIEEGPEGGWSRFSIRVAIPLSDELSTGSECGGDDGQCSAGECQSQRKGINSVIRAANDNGAKVFPLRAYPCGYVCQILEGGTKWCADLKTYRNGLYCNCGKGLLVDWMEEMAEETGGEMFELEDSEKVALTIKDIIENIRVGRLEYIEAGTDLKYPKRDLKRIRSHEFFIPMPMSGTYTTAYIYTWT